MADTRTAEEVLAEKAILDRGLPKWPQLRLRGTSVTVDQAKEIIRRTDSFWVWGGGNDRAWEAKVNEIVQVPPMGLEGPNNFRTYQARRDAWEAAIGYLHTEYLNNSWIASSYIGGPHGWCHPDGTIYNVGNIGKWPSGDEVYQDLLKLAKAFPFLDFAATIMYGEECEGPTEPVMSFRVSQGRVEVLDPLVNDPLADFYQPTAAERDAEFARNMQSILSGSLRRERGIPLAWIEEWGQRVQQNLQKETETYGS